MYIKPHVEKATLHDKKPYQLSHPWGNFPPPCMDNYMLPLMVNISVALCTYTAELFMYIVSMIGMEGEIQFVCFIVYKNKHINCFSLLIEGKDPVRCRYIYSPIKHF